MFAPRPMVEVCPGISNAALFIVRKGTKISEWDANGNREEGNY